MINQTLSFLIFTVFLILTPTKAQSLTVPLLLQHNELYIRLRNVYPSEMYPEIPEIAKFHLASRCRRSNYFVYGPGGQAAHSYFLRFAAVPVQEGNPQVFDGRLWPFRKRAAPQVVDPLVGDFCMKSITTVDDPFTALMANFQTKTVSFWFYPPGEGAAMNQPPSIGEVTFGEINQNQIGPGPRIRFILRSLVNPQQLPDSWVTDQPVQISVGGLQGVSCALKFDIAVNPLAVPTSVFQRLTRSLRDLTRAALIPTGLNSDLRSMIDQFAAEPLRKFDCRDANRLPDLMLGGLRITRDMLYGQVGDECRLTVVPYDPPQGQQCMFVMGNLFIKQFHFSVHFETPDGTQVAQFAPARHIG